MSDMPILYISLAAPMLIAVFLLRLSARRFAAFFVVGMTICLLSAYINNFLAMTGGMTPVDTVVRLTPISEELFKALPVFFYLAVFRPRREYILYCAVAVGLGFAMVENVHALLTVFSEGGLLYAVIRGFSAGAMHTVCGAMLGWGLTLTYRRAYLSVPVGFGFLCAAATCHAIYNLFVSAAYGYLATAGYFLPFVLAALILSIARKLPRQFTDE